MTTVNPDPVESCRYDWCRGHSFSASTEHVSRRWDDPIVAKDGTVTCYAHVDTAHRDPDEIYLFMQDGPDDDGAGLYLTAQQAAELISRLTEAIANRLDVEQPLPVDSSGVELAQVQLDWTPVFEADLAGKRAAESGETTW